MLRNRTVDAHATSKEATTMQHISQTMWTEFEQTRSPELRREIALQYLNLVRYVVTKFGAPPMSVPRLLEANDLVQVGVIGLLDAIDRFDPSRGVKFETYAMTRIRGTIQDEMRRLDWVPRSVRKKERATREAGEGDARTVSEQPGAQRHSEAMGVFMNATTGEGYSIDELSTEGSPDPLEVVGQDQLKAMLIHVVQTLPDDDRLIITLYYYEELTFKEIGTILQLSESRVFQKHGAVMKKLRAQLGGNER